MKLILAFMICLCLPVVSSADTVRDMLRSANGGDTILLEGRHYGTLSISNTAFDDFVTIRSDDPQNPATFDRVEIKDSRYIAISDIHVDGPDNGSANSKLVDVSGDSRFIHFSGSEVNGKIDGSDDYRGFQGHYGIHVGGGPSDIVIANNKIHDVKNAIVILGAQQIEIRDNQIDRIGNDSMKFAAVDGAVISGNTGASNVFGDPKAHLDFIQFQGSSENIEITGNVYLAGSTPWVQGIFLDDGHYENVLIENNVIYTGMIHGITISKGSNIVIRQNTLLNTPTEGHKATTVNVPEGSVVEYNVFTGTKGVEFGSNIQTQHLRPGGALHYTQLYRNAERGRGLSLDDLRPVKDSLAERSGAPLLHTSN